jgi:glycosyltransferase involved in cell wall biosynthesis
VQAWKGVNNVRLAVLASHPVQYYSPLYRELAKRLELSVFYAHQATPDQQAAAGFGVNFDWDLELLEGYRHVFLTNIARNPNAGHFNGCDSPDIGEAFDEHGVFDALLVMGWHLKVYWQGGFAAKRRGMKLIVRGDSHLDTPRHWIKRLIKRAVYPIFLRTFDAALYVGQRNKKYYRFYCYPETHLFFSPHCVDNERFSRDSTALAGAVMRERLGIAAEEKVVLFAGKLVEFKRPLDVIDAVVRMKTLSSTSVHVIVAGSGPLERVIRDRARESGIVTHFLGFQNQSKMPAVYAASDVLVLPSTGRETWGLVCNEALASGKPVVVSSAVGCAQDLAYDGTVGRVYPVGDIPALSDALKSMLSERPSPSSIHDLSARYSVSVAADGIVAALKCLIH